jgi:hypothetical protein
VRNLLNVQPASRHVGCHQHSYAAVLEARQGSLALRLRSVTVDLSCINAGPAVNRGPSQLLGQPICGCLFLDEHKGAAVDLGQRVDQQRHFQLLGAVRTHNPLFNILRRASHLSDADPNVRTQEVGSELLHVGGEGGGEHEGLAGSFGGHA